MGNTDKMSFTDINADTENGKQKKYWINQIFSNIIYEIKCLTAKLWTERLISEMKDKCPYLKIYQTENFVSLRTISPNLCITLDFSCKRI